MICHLDRDVFMQVFVLKLYHVNNITITAIKTKFIQASIKHSNVGYGTSKAGIFQGNEIGHFSFHTNFSNITLGTVQKSCHYYGEGTGSHQKITKDDKGGEVGWMGGLKKIHTITRGWWS